METFKMQPEITSSPVFKIGDEVTVHFINKTRCNAKIISIGYGIHDNKTVILHYIIQVNNQNPFAVHPKIIKHSHANNSQLTIDNLTIE